MHAVLTSSLTTPRHACLAVGGTEAGRQGGMPEDSYSEIPLKIDFAGLTRREVNR